MRIPQRLKTEARKAHAARIWWADFARDHRVEIEHACAFDRIKRGRIEAVMLTIVVGKKDRGWRS